MDTPNLPENEIEEITWQDDENRATLFLRSVFVLLSGALILGVQAHAPASMSESWSGVLYQCALNIVLPVCIIWFFFGQGLRPVEWLSDQKYNAWNYGLNFTQWKLHLKWAVALCIPVVGLVLLLKLNLLFPQSKEIGLGLGDNWVVYLSAAIMALVIGCGLVWMFLGYLLFGMAQGFSIVGAILSLCCLPILAITMPANVLSDASFIGYVLISFTFSLICWKTKSIAPAIYFVLITVPLAILILR